MSQWVSDHSLVYIVVESACSALLQLKWLTEQSLPKGRSAAANTLLHMPMNNNNYPPQERPQLLNSAAKSHANIHNLKIEFTKIHYQTTQDLCGTSHNDGVWSTALRSVMANHLIICSARQQHNCSMPHLSVVPTCHRPTPLLLWAGQ